MRLMIQRVKHGSVVVDGEIVGNIGNGLVVLVGFGQQDTEELVSEPVWQTMVNKMLGLRIFPDSNGKMNLGLNDFGGELLLVPQFTLYADSKKGKRPSFTGACPPAIASQLFDTFVKHAQQELQHTVATGIFGADMDVSLTNWGPVTIWLDSMDFCVK